MIEFIFWFSAVCIVFTYVGYPITLKIITKFFKRRNLRDYAYQPPITLLITVYNEEKKIIQKLNNCLELYPKDKLQILVASDASSDNTHNVVQSFIQSHNDYNIQIKRFERGGKEHAQKEALQYVTGDIIVFTDVATMITSGSIKSMVSLFAQNEIGAVDSISRVKGKHGGEGNYLDYDMKIRDMESNFSLVGLGGCLFACRKEIALADFSPSMQSDFRTALVVKRMGFRSILDVYAIAEFSDSGSEIKERKRKIRTTVRALNVFFNNIDLLKVFKYGFFSYQFFSHKLLKWLVPFFLISVWASNFVLVWESLFYNALFYLQGIFYLLAGIGLNFKIKSKFFKIPAFFVNANISIFLAWLKYIKGERMVYWTPTKREVK